jgi:SAM-dependent methyltransferase
MGQERKLLMDDFDKFPNKLIDDIQGDPFDNYCTSIFKEILEIISPQRVCDIGCGNGLYSVQVKAMCDCRLTGVDGSEYALQQAEQLGFDEVFLVSDLCNNQLPFEDESFDFVICKDVLEHLLDPEHLVREIVRITGRGKHVLLHVPNHFPIWARLKFLFDADIDPFGYFPDADRWNFPHIRFFTHDSMKKICSQHGLRVVLNLSYHFSTIPVFHRLLPNAVQKTVASRWPDHLSEGFTYLLCKE